MSTRSRKRSSVVSKNGISLGRSKGHGHPEDHDGMDVDSHFGDGKENLKSMIAKGSTTASHHKKSKGKARESLSAIDCTCSKGNDGSPMILCSECRIWHHFTCVELDEADAEEINVYVCPACTTITGRRSAMTWEGDQAIEEYPDDELTAVTRRKTAPKTRRISLEPRYTPEESEESSGSEDEYVDEREEPVRQTEPMEHRNTRMRRLSTASGSEVAEEVGKPRSSRGKVSRSSSPNNHGHLKRKAPHATTIRSSPPPPKKKRSESYTHTAADDPVRKYCLAKLEELFKDVFMRYPHVRIRDNDGWDSKAEDMDEGEDSHTSNTTVMTEKLEELSDEEKEALLNESRQFAQDLEECVFDIYSEPDKNNQPHAGGKYKERFRMLQFNLSKKDRVIIHQRITSGNISPKEISTMSSTDLADEETKQSIKLAEKEALEHSILLKSTAPRAKITHKGLQDIEDVNGEVVSAHEIEVVKEREQEEEERRERERMARLRTSQRQRTASMSVPPESPTSQRSPTIGETPWGGPPPIPAHAMSPTAVDFSGRISRPQLSMQTAFDMNSAEPELNLADLINIDDEQDPSASPTSVKQQPVIGPNFVSSPIDAPQTSVAPTMPTGISPFASLPERQRAASFDLNSLWTASKEETSATQIAESAPASEAVPTPVPTSTEEPRTEGSDKDEAMELDSNDANDQDFDMFLEKDNDGADEELIVTPIPPRDVEYLPQVWTGKITMPLDSSVPQETSLVARQIAGRPIPPDSPLWRTLFPSEQLRIEGRVPVENSVKYLMQMRLNATKELYAAAFLPISQTNKEDFNVFCNFLISKSRHGLVFPWGSRPKDYHPGRELYMIPLLQSEPLPEFVELLDELKLPKTRSKDYLLGIWILNKGKLTVLPNVASQSATPAPPAIQSPLSQTPPMNVPVYHTAPSVPQMPTHSLPQAPLPPSIAPAALAAEVASLTPEQLQEVLRTLASTTQMQLPPLPLPPPPIPQAPLHNINRPPSNHMPTPPMGQHSSLMTPNSQPWISAPPNTYPNYPPPNIPTFQQPAHINSPIPPGHPPFDRPDYNPRQDYDRPAYDRQGQGYDRDRDFRPGPQHSQADRGARGGDRGWRGNTGNRSGGQRGGQRGRGRGSGDGQDFNQRRGDSGWGRRGRHDGQAGPSWNL